MLAQRWLRISVATAVGIFSGGATLAQEAADACLATIRALCTLDPSTPCDSDADCTTQPGDLCDLENPRQVDPTCPSVAGGLTAQIAGLHRLDSSCPPPTLPQGSQCVLTHDVTLAQTLEVTSFTHLNCKGHRLVATTAGTLENVNAPSQPQVAILLREAYGVKIQNCVIDGFDFGVFALRGKVPALLGNDPGALSLLRNKLLQNTLQARFAGVTLVSYDNMEIANNRITFSTLAGRGVALMLDSDGNSISENVITGTADAIQAVRVPGPAGASNPVVGPPRRDMIAAGAAVRGAGIVIGQIDGNDPTLFNAVIDGTLYQLTTTTSPVPNEDFTADNLVEANEISYPYAAEAADAVTLAQWASESGIALVIALRTVVRNNTIRYVPVPIRVGAQNGPKQFPGTCRGDRGRLCLAGSDCRIPGYDLQDLGPCSLPPPQQVSWATGDSLIEANIIQGPFNSAILLAGQGTTVRENLVVGPLLQAPYGGGAVWAAISLWGGLSIATTTVERNTVSGVSEALGLRKTFQLSATSFGALVSLNDFSGDTTRVRISSGYDLTSELSTGAYGNYWNRSHCPGFLQSEDVRSLTGACSKQRVCKNHPSQFCLSNLDCPTADTCPATGSTFPTKSCSLRRSAQACNTDDECVLSDRVSFGPCQTFNVCSNDSTRFCTASSGCVTPGLCNARASRCNLQSTAVCATDEDCIFDMPVVRDSHPFIEPVAVQDPLTATPCPPPP
jgi:hypothetical protein